MRFLAAALLSLALPAAVLSAQDSDKTADGLDCVRYGEQVRFRNDGHDHLVHLHNRCSHRATCQVSTNVNPDAIEATLEPDGRQTVLTFRGSPARVFSATVRCSR